MLTQAVEGGMTKESASYLAGRLHEQRELIRQIMTRRDWQRVRHLLGIHQRQRRRFLNAAEEQGFDVQTLSTHCRAHIASLLEK
ncbi:MAG TPA: hypothetical protein DEB30_05215 [Candidatus Peribacter riflensis]|nr:MAG: hypothetical protein A2398_02370 [Candidatus Peribacteria bacterium RIFOXYB1_FULL_57_12]OGJ82119.1 MAG: hypothetical protein A2412_00145 [Candidatus Peribacteria bacterium RIFOXYC1_FULL_58_8]HBH19364.1 hypothetical protein [Candidatus Peribacter riflensis]HBU10161.1 hypothetical protein [Candidatus Peribacter riflensis]